MLCASQPSTAKEEKGHDDVIKYNRDVMMAFKEVNCYDFYVSVAHFSGGDKLTSFV